MNDKEFLDIIINNRLLEAEDTLDINEVDEEAASNKKINDNVNLIVDEYIKNINNQLKGFKVQSKNIKGEIETKVVNLNCSLLDNSTPIFDPEKKTLSFKIKINKAGTKETVRSKVGKAAHTINRAIGILTGGTKKDYSNLGGPAKM